MDKHPADARLRTGQDYLRGIERRRALYYGDQRVESVSRHPELSLQAGHIAQVYDVLAAPEHRQLVMAKDGGGSVPIAYKRPTSGADLAQLRGCVELALARTSPMLERLPLLAPSCLLALALCEARVDKESRCKGNALAFLQRQAGEQSYIVPATVDPRGNRALRADQQHDPDLSLRVVRESDAGIHVRGAKMVATAAAIADELIVLPTSGGVKEEIDYALSFAVPIDSDGITVIARRGYRHAERGDQQFSQFDESDAMVAFDDVFVPWERVFVYKEPEMVRAMRTHITAWSSIHFLIGAKAKAELMLGLASLISSHNGIRDTPGIQAKLMEIATYIETVGAFLTAAEARPVVAFADTVSPAPSLLAAGRYYAANNYHPLLKTVHDVAGSLASTGLSIGDVKDAAIRELVGKYYATDRIDGLTRLKVFRLIHDLTVGELAGHKALFMIFAEGSLMAHVSRLAGVFDLKPYEQQAARIVGDIE
ncbi:MAG: 4-hydroxyphenylacetate 3-hydroxylase N-terminal domain-containing protein [Reyranellaceae bacterium]